MSTATGCAYVSCRVDDLLLGIPLSRVREINRAVDVTPVPRAAASVSGLVNLRGELVTVIDLRRLLSGQPTKVQRRTRNVILQTEAEPVGLLVDQVGDVVESDNNALEPVPFAVRGVEAGMFAGVMQLEAGLLVVLDLDAVIRPTDDRA